MNAIASPRAHILQKARDTFFTRENSTRIARKLAQGDPAQLSRIPTAADYAVCWDEASINALDHRQREVLLASMDLESIRALAPASQKAVMRFMDHNAAGLLPPPPASVLKTLQSHGAAGVHDTVAAANTSNPPCDDGGHPEPVKGFSGGDRVAAAINGHAPANPPQPSGEPSPPLRGLDLVSAAISRQFK